MVAMGQVAAPPGAKWPAGGVLAGEYARPKGRSGHPPIGAAVRKLSADGFAEVLEHSEQDTPRLADMPPKPELPDRTPCPPGWHLTPRHEPSFVYDRASNRWVRGDWSCGCTKPPVVDEEALHEEQQRRAEVLGITLGGKYRTADNWRLVADKILPDKRIECIGMFGRRTKFERHELRSVEECSLDEDTWQAAWEGSDGGYGEFDGGGELG